jgi:hypothetical protein
MLTNTHHTTTLATILTTLVSALATTLATTTPALATTETCPNTTTRTGYSQALPQCRAYEPVSAPGAEPIFEFAGTPEVGDIRRGDGVSHQAQASASGDGLAYQTQYPPQGAESGGLYLRVKRLASGWVTEDMVPRQSVDSSILCNNAYIAAYTPELTRGLLGDGVGQPGSPLNGGVLHCGTDDPELVPGEPRGFQNLFVVDSAAGPYSLIDGIGEMLVGETVTDAWFQGASDDLNRVVFSESAKLTPEAPAGVDLYDSFAGYVRLVSWLPNGSPTVGVLANGYEPEDSTCCSGPAPFTHSVSADGSRVVFQAGERLYVRIHPEQPQSPVNGAEECTDTADACTEELDSRQGGSEAGGGEFKWATPDGSRVFFMDERDLTPGATAAPGSPDLYEYNAEAAVGSRLTDLTVDEAEHADVLGVSGISDTGSYVYFVAQGSLTSQANSAGDQAISGQPNLYVRHRAETVFIGTLNPTFDEQINAGSDASDWEAPAMTSRVTSSGQYIAFDSTRSLTGYDNADVVGGVPDDEIFVYDATRAELKCVSCSPTGAPSTAYARIGVPLKDQFGGGSPLKAVGYLQRNLSEDGHVFFSTAEKLLPAATNGVSNVYEYADGALRLLSTGTSSRPSYFLDASPSGDDVFITSSQDLPSGGEGAEFKVYDDRVDGGFPEPATPEECESETCRGPVTAAAPLSQPPTTVVFGQGNIKPAIQATSKSRSSGGATRATKLKQALKQCRKKKNRRKRAECEATAQHKYGVKRAKKPSTATRIGGGR